MTKPIKIIRYKNKDMAIIVPDIDDRKLESLRECQGDEFWGCIQINCQRGRFTTVEKKVTYKLGKAGS